VTAFFCSLTALTPAERHEHQQLLARLAESVLRTEEIPDGYAFEIDGRRMSMKDLAAWTELEGRCCPFFEFSLNPTRENERLTLRLTGREGVKPFIRSEFSKIFA
jgi:hypothetical protein